MLALYLLDLLECDRPDEVVTWHFCESGGATTQATGGRIVRSLILQLLNSSKDLFRCLTGL